MLYLSIAYFACLVMDMYITRRRIKDYGPEIELNSFIKKLATLLGPELGALIGVGTIGIGWLYIFNYFHLSSLLAISLGWKLKMFKIQIDSIFFEHQLKKMAKVINDKHFGSEDATLPSGDLTSKPDPKSPEDRNAQ